MMAILNRKTNMTNMKKLLFTFLAIFSFQIPFAQTVFESEGKFGLKDEIDNSIILKAEYDQIFGENETDGPWLLCQFNPKYKGENPKQKHDFAKLRAKYDKEELDGKIWELIELKPKEEGFPFLPNMLYGFLEDVSGKPIPTKFEAIHFISSFEEYIVKKGGSYYQYSPFKNKLNKKTRAEKLNFIDDEYFIFERDGKWGMMDFVFDILIKPEFDSFEYVEDLQTYKFIRNGTFQLVSEQERRQLYPKEPLQEIRTKSGSGFEGQIIAKQKGKWGLTQTYSGIWTIKPVYENLRFSSSKEYLFAKKEGKWGIIDMEENQIIAFQYEDMKEGFDNMFYVKNEGKYGLYGLDGEEIYEQLGFTFDSLRFARNQEYLVYDNDKIGLYDKINATLLLPVSFNKITFPEPEPNKLSAENSLEDYIGQNWVEVKKDGKLGLYEVSEKNGSQELFPPKFDAWRDISETNQEGISELNWFLIQKNGKWGVFSKGSKTEEISFEYDSIHPEVNDGMLTAQKDGKWGLISKNGNEIQLKFIYDEILPNPSYSTYLMKYKGKWGKQTIGFDDGTDFFGEDFSRMVNIIEVVPFEYTLEEAKLMEKAPDMNVELGKGFELILESNASTGFKWNWLNKEAVFIVELAKHKYTDSGTELVGRGGEETWSFKAIKKGVQAIQFGYTRPGGVLGKEMEKRRFVIEVE
jgi:predicted secreted protein